jgi:glycerol kinase
MGYVLAIDAGTTGERAVVYDAVSRLAGCAYRELQMLYPQRGWVEQDPEDVWRRIRSVIADALRLAGCAPQDVVAVRITNQRAFAVEWNAETRLPLAPMIVWQDARTVESCRALGEQGMFMTPNTSTTKFEWLVRNVSAARDAMKRGRLSRFWTSGPAAVASYLETTPRLLSK